MAAPATYFTWGTVTDTYFGVTGDQDSDSLHNPDIVPVQGRVTFTPMLPSGAPLLFPGAPFAATPVSVVAVYDDQGRLTLNNSVGVRLVATDNPLETYTNWVWQAEFVVAVGDVNVVRNTFAFRLPGNTTVDLATVQPVAVVNGIPSTVGPPGAPGTGVILRGMFTGTDSTVLPTGYGAAQNGWAYRVRSVDGSYDELWVWVWTGSSGSWVDAGPAFGAATIDDTTSSTVTTYSSAQIDALIGDALTAAQAYTDQALAAYSAPDYIRVQNTDLTWPARDAAPDRHVTWVGVDFPPVGNGYAVIGMDSAELVAQLP
jgi:hypothetical protein